jgi:hypothetical protein
LNNVGGFCWQKEEEHNATSHYNLESLVVVPVRLRPSPLLPPLGLHREQEKESKREEANPNGLVVTNLLRHP